MGIVISGRSLRLSFREYTLNLQHSTIKLRKMEVSTTIAVIAVLFYVIHMIFDGFRRKLGVQAKMELERSTSIALATDKMTTIARDMLLYHRLQNPSKLQAHVIEDARTRLLEFLDETISQAHRSQRSHTSILNLDEYCPNALFSYVSETNMRTTFAWSEYLARRKAGGPREVFSTRGYAEYWLECAAPVKLVDGAWLARLHHGWTPIELKHITRIAWQVFSEELGDGDLDKNHVQLYAKLLQSFGSKLPPGDAIEFIDPKVNPNNDARIWAAANAQLALGLFPDDFLPETLGFNLAYECAAFDTLVCAHELKELNLDPSYFNLHITIDNADSGHSAMALDAVTKFLKTRDIEDRHRRWRRVQAGFLLATHMPSIPSGPSPTELAVVEIFSCKLNCSSAAHQLCHGLIGGLRGMSLQAWMDPSKWENRKFRFATALANSRWVVSGEPTKSQFVRELAWKGRMFGAFTKMEKAAVERWIAALEPPLEQPDHNGRYKDFIGAVPGFTKALLPMHFSATLEPTFPKIADFNTVVLKEPISQRRIAILLLYSLIPLQQSLASPVKAATYEGMLALRILRILNGFSATVDNAVDGMDEVHYPFRRSISDLAMQLGSMEFGGKTLHSLPQKEASWNWLERVALDSESNSKFLFGVQYGFIINIAMNRSLLHASGINEDVIKALEDIGIAVLEEMACLDVEDIWECQLGLSVMTSCLLG